MMIKSKLNTPKPPKKPIVSVIRTERNGNPSIQQNRPNPPNREILVRNVPN